MEDMKVVFYENGYEYMYELGTVKEADAMYGELVENPDVSWVKLVNEEGIVVNASPWQGCHY